MDTFFIKSAAGASSLEFFERTPADTRLPIERFKVRVTDLELSAVVRVYAGDEHTHPALLFAQMAASWQGWQGEIVWEPLEGELSLRCTQNRNGHVFIHAALHSGPTENDWAVSATILAEAGQLEEIASAAMSFFGAAG